MKTVLSTTYSFLQKPLFWLAPEISHHLTLRVLQTLNKARLIAKLMPVPVNKPINVMGLSFKNAIGLAAGLDKNGRYIDALSALGFGFIEVGTLTPRAQKGQLQPRLFRLPDAYALINRMGFNNLGVNQFIQYVHNKKYQVPLGINIGKNADTPLENATNDYLYCLEQVYPYADYVTVNISSPNTKNLRQLQNNIALHPLLNALVESRIQLCARYQKYLPLALKIAPDLNDIEVRMIAQSVKQFGIDAVIAVNTTLEREKIAGIKHANEVGGLSGAPLFEKSNHIISMLRAELGPDIPIIGVGGIMSADDAKAKIKAGATLLQLYTGFIYKGPALIAECAKAVYS